MTPGTKLGREEALGVADEADALDRRHGGCGGFAELDFERRRPRASAALRKGFFSLKSV